MSDNAKQDVGSLLKVMHNAASKASVEYSEQAWADLSYTLTYLSTTALAASKTASLLALEETRSLIVPEDVVEALLAEIEDIGDGGHYL